MLNELKQLIKASGRHTNVQKKYKERMKKSTTEEKAMQKT